MLSQKILNFINELADDSAEITKKYFRLPNGEMMKDDDSPVTKADREIEKTIREKIEKKFPSHGIIGEEFGNHNEKAEFKWILDPIDGTSSFIIGRPTFGTLIAFAYQEKPILGLMNQAITKERWIGIDQENQNNQELKNGSWLNGKKISSRKNCFELADAILCTTSSFFFQNEDEKLFKQLNNKTKYQNFGGVVYGGDCYLYAMLASGFVDIVIDPGLKIYDYAAMIPIIKGAGGFVSDWKGKDLGLSSGIKMLACANEKIWQKALGALQNK